VIRPTAIRDLTVDAPRGPHGGRFIAAGSGLVRAGEHLYVIADDERELAVFPAEGEAPGTLRRMLPGELPSDPAERKRQKPDFEALVLLPAAVLPGDGGGALLALESGSRDSRRGGVLWALDQNGALSGEPRRLDLAPLYAALAAEIPDLNIEGAAVAGDRLLLFQRGNGAGAVNAAVELGLEECLPDIGRGRLSDDAVRGQRRYDLGTVDGVRLAFSDAAALGDGRIVYTAVAEGGDDTYADGSCAGAGVGVLTAEGERSEWEQLDPPAKVEGVEARANADGTIALLMVADADDPAKPSPLLAAALTGR
jgi:hypothetical protein